MPVTVPRRGAGRFFVLFCDPTNTVCPDCDELRLDSLSYNSGLLWEWLQMRFTLKTL